MRFVLFVYIQLILLVITHGGMLKGANSTFNCSTVLESSYWKTESESFFLSEGESLELDCGVCSRCPEMAVECSSNYSVRSWTIQRSRYLGFGGDIKGVVQDQPFDLPDIRMRLHKRIWPVEAEFPEYMDLLLRKGLLIPRKPKEKLDPESEKKNKTLEPNVALYILYAGINKQAEVLRSTKKRSRRARVQVIKDTVYIRQARLSDTGVYYCHWDGKRMKEWVVTVSRPNEEPYRQINLPLYVHPDARAIISQIKDAKKPATMTTASSNATNVPEQPRKKRKNPRWCRSAASEQQLMTELDPENLVDYNLRLYTEWRSWSDCVPCTLSGTVFDTLGMGYQMRVGICRVRVLDPFHPIRPHSLSLQINEILRSYGDRGLPCRSHIIREAMMKSGPRELKYRPSEIQQRRCIEMCNQLELAKTKFKYRAPSRIRLRISEGEQVTVSCPIRGQVQGPITWFYSIANITKMVEFTETALSPSTIVQYISPSAFLVERLDPIHVNQLHDVTRGRFRMDPSQSIIVAEMISEPGRGEKRLHHLACVHGDPQATTKFSDWSGIIELEVVPRLASVVIMGKISQVVLLIIPFVLACGTFFVVVLAIQTERKSNMVAAAEGYTNKPPP